MPSFIGLCVLLMVGHLLRSWLRPLRWMYLPSCVIGGLVGLAVLQIAQQSGHPIPEVWTAGWSKLPGLLINIVFACLFLGVVVPKLSVVARRAGPQLGYGQIVAWGQYVVGIGLFMLVILPMWPKLPAMFGAIMPVGFEGGHGTAAGMADTFDKNGWPAGKDFALASATAGICSAIVVGMILINWAVRCGHTVRKKNPENVAEDMTIGVIPLDKRPSAGKLTVSSDVIESFTLHLVIVGMACGIGWLLKQGLLASADGISKLANWTNEAFAAVREILAVAGEPLASFGETVAAVSGTVAAGSGTFTAVAKSFPLFPLCMLGGLLIQILDQKYDKHKQIDLGLMRRIQNCALDFLVVAAIATIKIEALSGSWAPLLMLVAAGILWNVFCVLVLARWLLPDAWFERAIAEMGQSMGVTATGLLLLRVVDPDYETPAADAFASKQLLHEPFMGGGLWTSAAVPLLVVWGGWPVFGIAAGAMGVWLIVMTGARTLRRAG